MTPLSGFYYSCPNCPIPKYPYTNNPIPLKYPNLSNIQQLLKYKTSLEPLHKTTMPLVVPGMMGGSGNSNQQEDWMNKLMGKKITEGSSDATVRLRILIVNDRRGLEC